MIDPDPLASVRAAYAAAAARYARDVPARFHAAPLNHAMIPPFAEFRRVLAPGGHLLLAFPGHDGTSEAFDHVVSRAYRFAPGWIAGSLAGFSEVARLVIAGTEDSRRGFPQVCLLARRTG